MEACDCCGKRVDERSMETVEDGSNAFLSHGPFMVCQACSGMYDDQELLDKCIEQAESGTPDSLKPGAGQVQSPEPGVDK